MRRYLSGRRLASLCIVVLGAMAISGMSRTTTEAKQVAARGSDRQVAREKLIALRGQVALKEVEVETEREILKQKLMRVPVVEQELLEMKSMVFGASTFDLDGLDEAGFVKFGEIARGLCSTGSSAEVLIRELREAKKTSSVQDALKSVRTFFDAAKAGAKSELEKELGPLREDLSRHASALAGKRLDAEDAERRYRDAR